MKRVLTTASGADAMVARTLTIRGYRNVPSQAQASPHRPATDTRITVTPYPFPVPQSRVREWSNCNWEPPSVRHIVAPNTATWKAAGLRHGHMSAIALRWDVACILPIYC